MKLDYLIFNTSLGWMGILGSQDGSRNVVLPQVSPEQTLHLLSEFALKWHNQTLSEDKSDYFAALPQRIKHYLGGEPISFPAKLDLSWASPFQRKVWEVTRSIPYGETRTYAWVASKLGRPKAARAVRQALARDPLPIIIPCQRVICSNGNLGGFSSSKLWKRRLLETETKTT